MIKKIVRKVELKNLHSAKDDLAYWLGRSEEERIAAVDYLRREYYGSTERLQKVARIIKRA